MHHLKHDFPCKSILTHDDNQNDVYILRMEITEPLSTLKSLIEQKCGFKLLDYSFLLQNSVMLENHKNLVDQCIEGKGLVQIHIQMKHSEKQINIVDVLKLAENNIDISENTSSANAKDKHILRWIVDAQYRKDQERLKIPTDPKDWSQMHVKHWLQWAVRQFNLVSLKLADWNITGIQLCDLSIKEFQAKVPLDPGDIFWTHLELLKKCKSVAVVQRSQIEQKNNTLSEKPERVKFHTAHKFLSSNTSASIDLSGESITNLEVTPFVIATSNKIMNTGQIQLWQFLLELLTCQEHNSSIQWVGTEGEFKLNQPEVVAQLWGARKSKPFMNYEKLSRALRYYYDGDMICKVHGKRFVYKFVYDLKQLLGYSAAELSATCNQNYKCYCLLRSAQHTYLHGNH